KIHSPHSIARHKSRNAMLPAAMMNSAVMGMLPTHLLPVSGSPRKRASEFLERELCKAKRNRLC
ncbi:MAG: hypothetical protein LBC85_04460, partial [Fibromonadaceae bacterium]|nr:hypothetical protein [Fibromonadaceae bacterium]